MQKVLTVLRDTRRIDENQVIVVSVKGRQRPAGKVALDALGKRFGG